MSGETDVELSVIIPAFDEARVIGDAVARVADVLDGRGEILVVDDGSGDDTAAIAERLLRGRGRVLRLPSNQGKGAAVKAGMLAATGRFRLFLDADLSIDPSYLREALELLRDADVVVASRRAARSTLVKRQPLVREVLGTAYRSTAALLLVGGISDFTCGLKGFSAPVARRLFELSRVPRFGFDVEVLYLARRLGYRIVELPVAWRDDPDTRVRVLVDSARSLVELAAIPCNALLGRYGRLEPAPPALRSAGRDHLVDTQPRQP